MKPLKISKELAGAIAEEERRQAIDTAKKKAVAQHADYDTFKKMVSVAHLKPLHAAGSLGSRGCSLPAWQIDPGQLQASPADADAPAHQSCSSKISTQQTQIAFDNPTQQHSRCPAAAADDKCLLAPAPAQIALPCTSQEFVRDWKRHCPTAESKYRFLKQCGPDGLARLFKVELDGVILGQMLTVLQQHWKQHAQQQQQLQQAVVQPQQQANPEQQQADSQQQAHLQQQQHASSEQPCQHSGSQCSNGSAAAASSAADAAGVVAEAMWGVQVLQSLSGVGRFDLNVRLMDKPSKAAAAELCRELQEALQEAVQQQEQQQQEQQQQDAVQALADLQASMLKLRV